MNPLDERLNDQLERLVQIRGRAGQQAGGFTRSAPAQERAPEIDDLVILARRLQRAPHVQVAPEFSEQLERRLLHRHAELRLQEHKQRSLFRGLRARPVLSTVLGLCVLFCLLSTGLLALAAQVSDPTNPLYTIRQWEQHAQVQLSHSPADQAALDLQFAHDQLGALPSLANPAHEGAYRQGLRELDQQIDAATTTIHELPAGSQRDQLTGELTTLKSDAIQELRGLLMRLDLSEQLATTEELGRLGNSVPVLTHATLILPTHPDGRATISLEGSDLEAGAQLLVNGNIVDASGTQQQGQLVFVVDWKGNQHPERLGILNPDGTAAQTTVITITGATNGTNGNPNGNSNKPSSTPTPHGNKPPVIPTPHGNQPAATPTPHH